jgi:hypothetical protein
MIRHPSIFIMLAFVLRSFSFAAENPAAKHVAPENADRTRNDVHHAQESLRSPRHVEPFEILERLEARPHVFAVDDLYIPRHRADSWIAEVAQCGAPRARGESRIAVVPAVESAVATDGRG